MFQYCTKQSIAEIKKLDEEDKKGLLVRHIRLICIFYAICAWETF